MKSLIKEASHVQRTIQKVTGKIWPAAIIEIARGSRALWELENYDNSERVLYGVWSGGQKNSDSL